MRLVGGYGTMKTAVTFGEVMMRLATPGFQRFNQARGLEISYAGGEANVAASLAQFGTPAEFVTRVPANDLGEACVCFLRQYGIGVRHIKRGGQRLGLYFLETGAAQRASKVLYDRADSAFATVEPGVFDWARVFNEADWFHFTGITPAVSESAANTCLEAVRCAYEMGLTVSCDLNYRAKLWKWGKSAGQVMPELLQYCRVVVANEEDAEKVLDIRATGVDVSTGKVEAASYVSVCEDMIHRFPNIQQVAITLRGSRSASHNTWSGLLYTEHALHVAPVYDIVPIVDRVGGGDSFAGGLIHALKHGADPKQTIDFAVAASCLKHSIPGDFNLVHLEEVEKLMKGDASGRVTR